MKRVKEGGAAARAGRPVPGDLVVKVEGVSTVGIDPASLSLLVVGQPGSLCRLSVKPSGSAQVCVCVCVCGVCV